MLGIGYAKIIDNQQEEIQQLKDRVETLEGRIDAVHTLIESKPCRWEEGELLQNDRWWLFPVVFRRVEAIANYLGINFKEEEEVVYQAPPETQTVIRAYKLEKKRRRKKNERS